MPIQFSNNDSVYFNGQNRPVREHVEQLADKLTSAGEVGDLALLATEYEARVGNNDGVISADEFAGFREVLDKAVFGRGGPQRYVDVPAGREAIDLISARVGLLNGTLDPASVADQD